MKTPARARYCNCKSRDAVGFRTAYLMATHPGGERQLGVMHDGSGSDRGLAAAAGALIGPGLGLWPPGFVHAQQGGTKAVFEMTYAGRLAMFAIRVSYPGGHSVWLTRRFPTVAWGLKWD